MLVTSLYETKEAIISACRSAIELGPRAFPPDLPRNPLSPEIPVWHPFESKVWGIGETIRQSLNAKPKLKKDPAILQAILDVAQYRNLRRGRQTFVMLLGFTGAAGYAPFIAELIDDPDVYGHAVDTLLKMRAPGYAHQIAALTNCPYAWVRRLASRYVERYPQQAQ